MHKLFTIKNEKLEVIINSLGAQLWSIKDSDQVEYLWQGDKIYWEDKAINLFPYIARLTEGKYSVFGNEYKMDIHGFLKNSRMELIKETENEVIFVLEDSKLTKSQYPYQFELEIDYKLVGKTIEITFLVKNKDAKNMYFGIGGHPGFNLPLIGDEKFEDYYLEFPLSNGAMKIGMSENCFVTGEIEKFSLSKGNILKLQHELFNNDAIILSKMGPEVFLKSKKSKMGLCISYPQMNYLGIWHKPKTKAPYLCIEPWTSLPSRVNIVEDLEKQENLISLKSGEVYKNEWKIEVL